MVKTSGCYVDVSHPGSMADHAAQRRAALDGLMVWAGRLGSKPTDREEGDQPEAGIAHATRLEFLDQVVLGELALLGLRPLHAEPHPVDGDALSSRDLLETDPMTAII
jgi:hypothetical protein